MLSLSLMLCATTACEEEKPYTPFQIATSLPAPSSPPAQENVDEENGKKDTRKLNVSRRAPKKTKEWRVFGRTLHAPADTILQVALEDSAEGSESVFAWAIASRPGASSKNAGIWRFSKSGEATERLLALPSSLPQGKDCELRAELKSTGAHSFTSKIKARCNARLLPGTPVVALNVLSDGAAAAPLVSLMMQEPSVGEKIELEVNSEDRDGDGLDDVEVITTLISPEGQKESLPLRWLTRTAGASRQPDSPSRELSKRATRVHTSSIRKAEREKVPAQVSTLRRLVSSLCSEWGTPKITHPGGDSIACGDIKGSMLSLGESLVQAYVGQGELEHALGASERQTWFDDKRRSEKSTLLLLSKLETKEAVKLARFNVPTERPGLPHASPLLFDEKGQLWAKTRLGKTKRLTMKGDPPLVVEATDEQPAQVQKAPEWNVLPQNASGHTLAAALPSCQRSEVQLAFSSEEGAAPAPLPISLLAPRPGSCSSFSGTQLSPTPLAWHGSSLYLILGGQVWSSTGGRPSSSEAYAWATHLGLAVRQRSGLSLWTGDITEGLNHCSVNSAGDKVACVSENSVLVLSTAAPKKR